jgi:hypothetical protein
MRACFNATVYKDYWPMFATGIVYITHSVPNYLIFYYGISKYNVFSMYLSKFVATVKKPKYLIIWNWRKYLFSMGYQIRVFAIVDFRRTPLMQCANGEEDAHQNIISVLILLSKKERKKSHQAHYYTKSFRYVSQMGSRRLA